MLERGDGAGLPLRLMVPMRLLGERAVELLGVIPGGVDAEQVFIPVGSVQLRVCPAGHEVVPTQVAPSAGPDQVPFEQLNVAIPVSVAVEMTSAVLPEAVALAGPEQLLPPTIQLKV